MTGYDYAEAAREIMFEVVAFILYAGLGIMAIAVVAFIISESFRCLRGSVKKWGWRERPPRR